MLSPLLGDDDDPLCSPPPPDIHLFCLLFLFIKLFLRFFSLCESSFLSIFVISNDGGGGFKGM